jgi:mitochondrial fission protein ELM1
MTWTVSSSPRTPEETLASLEKLAKSHDNCIFFKSQDTPAGWVEEQYAMNGVVWVTADSISMIFESITAGCRVGVLPVEWKHSHNKFERSIDYLVQNGWAISYEGWHTGARSEVNRAPLDEADRCAKEILKRWWPDRLQ